MRVGRALPLLAACATLSLGCASAPRSGSRAASEEVRRTWARAVVMIDRGKAGFIYGRRDEPETREALARIPAGEKLPAVVYLHGCSALSTGNYDYAAFLARAGYAVLMPDSFARRHRPKTCDPRRKRALFGAPFEQVAEMRQEEARYAARAARRLPWVDGENLFLFGQSQGGTAAASYEGDEFRAVVVSGSRCQRGVRLPSATPILSLYSENNPWLRGRNPRGCLEGAFGRSPPIEFHLFPGSRHNFAQFPPARKIIREFLRRHTRRRR